MADLNVTEMRGVSNHHPSPTNALASLAGGKKRNPAKQVLDEERMLYLGHGYKLFAYPIRQRGVKELEWGHCVAGERYGREDYRHYHTLESAVVDLAARLRQELPEARVLKICSKILRGTQ